MTDRLRIILPWPNEKLSPNARGHWGAKAEARKKSRGAARFRCRQAGGENWCGEAPIAGLIFCPPDLRRRDLDNFMARCKHQIDGVADVIGVDDSKWSWLAPEWGEVRKPGCVILKLSVVRFGQLFPFRMEAGDG